MSIYIEQIIKISYFINHEIQENLSNANQYDYRVTAASAQEPLVFLAIGSWVRSSCLVSFG